MEPVTEAELRKLSEEGRAWTDFVATCRDGVYEAWFAQNRVGAALQRPDFHLYGTATSPTGAAARPAADAAAQVDHAVYAEVA